MKRTFVLACLAAALGYTLSGQRAGAQPPSGGLSVGAAQKTFDEADSRAAELAKSILSAEGEPNEGRQALGERLRPVVEESFNARQQLQQAKLEQLRRRLDEVEKSIKEREENKEAIIKSRIEELLSPKTADQKTQQAHEQTFKHARRVTDDDIPTVPQPRLPESLPPGTERRLRYVQEQVEVNGEVKTVTRPIYEIVQSGQSNAPQQYGDDDDGFVAPPLKSNDQSMTDHGAASARSTFDLAMRERLAQLDAEAAEEDRKAAEQQLPGLRELYERGAAPKRALHDAEHELRQAERALKRAKATLEALALERTELAAAADADVAEAQAEVQREAAKVRIAVANVDAAKAQEAQLEADVEGATSSVSFQQKLYKRLDQLARVEKAVDPRLVDEKEEKLREAQTTLARAKAAVTAGKANVAKAEPAVEEARAALSVAEARLVAAQARRERLSRSNKGADLKQGHPWEAKILAALDGPTEFKFVDTPLADVVQYLKELHQIEIRLDGRALKHERIEADTPVTCDVSGTTLRSALGLMLRELDLTYVLRDEALLITTKDEAENMAPGETLSDRPPDGAGSKSSETVPSQP